MRDKIKLNSLAVELRRDWDLNPYSPIDLFSIVLSKLPDLTILFYPMSPVSPGASGMQPRDPCRPWRGTLASGHKPR